MIATHALLLAILLPLCCFAPGFLFVRRLRWTPPEKLSASVGLSLVLLYLATTFIFLTQLPLLTYYAIPLASLAAAVRARADLAHFLSHHSVRRALKQFSFLLLFSFLVTSLVRHLSGGGWAGDWYEHFERTVFFLHQRPLDHRFLDTYLFPARPPMMNAVAAAFLAVTRADFDLFQLVFLFLNLLAALPCLLIAGRLIPNGARRTTLVTCSLALCPLFLQNLTFTWTKLLAAFYVILALALYSRALRRRRDPSRLIAAFVALAAGCLVHYSAGPYTVFVLLHYLLTCWRRPRKYTELLASAILSAALLLTWFSWSLAYYGTSDTFTSNTSVTDARHYTPAQNLQKIGLNLVNTLVPHQFRMTHRQFDEDYVQPRRIAYWRDYFFFPYQDNLPTTLGSFGWVVFLYLVYKINRPRPSSPLTPERLFWLTFTPFSILAGVAVHGTPDEFGLTHVTLQPLALLGVTAVAAGLPLLPRALRHLAILFLAVDVVLGLFIHFHVEQDFFHSVYIDGVPHTPLSLDMISRQGVLNSISRTDYAYFADHLLPVRPLIRLALLALTVAIFHRLARAAFPARPRVPATFYLTLPILAAGVAACADDATHPAPDDPARSATEFHPHPATAADLAAHLRPETRALRASPHSAAARAALAYGAYRYDDVGMAIDQWTESLLLNPDDPVVRHNLLLVLRLADRNPMNLPEISAALWPQLQPDSPFAQTTLAAALLNRGHIDAALARTDLALHLNPRLPDAHFVRAEALIANGDLPHASEELTTTLRLNPDHVQARRLLSQPTSTTRPSP